MEQRPEITIFQVKRDTIDHLPKEAVDHLTARRPKSGSSEKVDQILHALSAMTEDVFFLSWTGTKTPRGAFIRGNVLSYAKSGIVMSEAGRNMGTYTRVMEFGGPNHDQHQMLLFYRGVDMVKLRNGTTEPKILVASTHLALKTLAETMPIVLYELWQVCKDPNHKIWGDCGSELEKLALIKNGQVHGSIKNIVLSSLVTADDGIDFSLISPIMGTCPDCHHEEHDGRACGLIEATGRCDCRKLNK